MSRALAILLAVLIAAAVGFGIWRLTDSTTASYIVTAVGAFGSVATLIIRDPASGKNDGKGEAANLSVSADRGGVAAGGDVIVGEGGIHTGGDPRQKS